MACQPKQNSTACSVSYCQARHTPNKQYRTAPMAVSKLQWHSATYFHLSKGSMQAMTCFLVMIAQWCWLSLRYPCLFIIDNANNARISKERHCKRIANAITADVVSITRRTTAAKAYDVIAPVPKYTAEKHTHAPAYNRCPGTPQPAAGVNHVPKINPINEQDTQTYHPVSP